MIKVLEEDIVFNELQTDPCKGVSNVTAACPNCPSDGESKCSWGCTLIPGNIGWPVYAGGTCEDSCEDQNTQCNNGTPGNTYLRCKGGCALPSVPCAGGQQTDCTNYQPIQP